MIFSAVLTALQGLLAACGAAVVPHAVDGGSTVEGAHGGHTLVSSGSYQSAEDGEELLSFSWPAVKHR